MADSTLYHVAFSKRKKVKKSYTKSLYTKSIFKKESLTVCVKKAHRSLFSGAYIGTQKESTVLKSNFTIHEKEPEENKNSSKHTT